MQLNSYIPVVVPAVSAPDETIDGLLGDSVTLTITIEDASPPVQPTAITWSFVGQAVPALTIASSPHYEFSENRKELVINNLTYADGGNYTITARNNAGHNYTTLTLRVTGTFALTSTLKLRYM